MENMKFWNAMARPPLDALKTIKGGRLSGMSNISPQWRYKVMTENFGMVGFGWKYTVEKIWTSQGAYDEQFAFASINLYVLVDGVWSDAIPGEGGSMLVAKEKSGLHNSDEAFKMAVTDALGTAMAKLGVAADIYLARFDGSKYNEPVEFKRSINSKEDVHREVPPTGDSLPVDEQFPMAEQAQELANGFTPKQLEEAGNMIAIKNDSGKSIPQIKVFLRTLPAEEKYSVSKIVEMLKEKE